MKDLLENLMGFIYSLSMGDYFFFIGTFLLIVLFIYIIYLLKTEPEELPKKKEEKLGENADFSFLCSKKSQTSTYRGHAGLRCSSITFKTFP